MSNKIYIVTMENDEMDPVEAGYASSQNIADKMIKKISTTEGFEHNTCKSYQASIDYLEINDEPICFENDTANPTDNNDLVVQFAILWGMDIGSASSLKEVEIANEMKKWNSDELYRLFSEWKDEYLSQDEIEDSVEFFRSKVTNWFYLTKKVEKLSMPGKKMKGSCE